MPATPPPSTPRSPATPHGTAAAAVGLYDGQHEHDACGVAFVATLRGAAGHDIVEHALTALHNLDHRGAVGAEPDSGDGAGILTQTPGRVLPARDGHHVAPGGPLCGGHPLLAGRRCRAGAQGCRVGARCRPS